MICSHCGAENNVPNARICITCQEPLPQHNGQQVPIFRGSTKSPRSDMTNYQMFTSQSPPPPPTQVSNIQSLAFGPAPPKATNSGNIQRPKIPPSTLPTPEPVAPPQAINHPQTNPPDSGSPPAQNHVPAPIPQSPAPIANQPMRVQSNAHDNSPPPQAGPLGLNLGDISPFSLYATGFMLGLAVIFFIIDLYILISLNQST